MRKLMLICCLAAAAATAHAQPRKPGLWETSSSTITPQSPTPIKTTTMVCLTQASIDRFGGPQPQLRDGCQITGITKTGTGMTGKFTCSGRMVGDGTIESTATDDTHASGSVKFKGTVQAGPRSIDIAWSIASTSTFKGADCGDVKPLPLPPN